MSHSRAKTRYLDVRDMRRLVDAVGLNNLTATLVQYLKADFLRWHEFEKCPRTANHSALGVIELMPISDDLLFSFKYVNGHPKNFLQGLPTVMAFGVLSEMATGWPVLISEMTILTAIRTAAASVLAAQAMAQPDSRTMAMIGNGSQSEFQILAFQSLMGIEEVRLFDIDRASTKKVLNNLNGVSGLTLIETSNVADAVRGADVVTTCTADKANATILTASMIEPGMHLNAIGGDCPGKTELDHRILANAKVVVEYAPQSRVEGEIQQMDADFPVTELWQVLSGQCRGRDSESQVTIFDSVGFSLEDFSALRLVYAEAIRRSIGADIEIIPEMEDVKDLFGTLQAVAGTRK